MEHLSTTCVIGGGGPAGMMLGYLLARAGVDVTVLEKHKDFLRDFRGDTVHPSTLQIMHELGLLDEFLRRPHQGRAGDDAARPAYHPRRSVGGGRWPPFHRARTGPSRARDVRRSHRRA